MASIKKRGVSMGKQNIDYCNRAVVRIEEQ
jgi:hypothetical protein